MVVVTAGKVGSRQLFERQLVDYALLCPSHHRRLGVEGARKK